MHGLFIDDDCLISGCGNETRNCLSYKLVMQVMINEKLRMTCFCAYSKIVNVGKEFNSQGQHAIPKTFLIIIFPHIYA